jgi:signal transduction histidine kinase
MRDREEQNFRQLVKSNRIVASVVSHELRNLCGAIALLCSHLDQKHTLSGDEDFQGIISLVKGLEKVALRELHPQGAEVEQVSLRQVLDHLRIVIESEWKDIGGLVRWRLLETNPLVVADPPGLLQVFLNLANNSHRAVQKSSRRELEIMVLADAESVVIQFQDSGPGIESPERLFQPFQTGADGTGLGLFLSRAVVRSYGGDLRFEPNLSRSCFVVKLQRV